MHPCVAVWGAAIATISRRCNHLARDHRRTAAWRCHTGPARRSFTLASPMTEIATSATGSEPEHLDTYDAAVVEAKGRRTWEERGDHRSALDHPEKSFYNLVMFPYPSGEGLHVGHILPYSGADIYGRWRRLHGDTV